MADFDAVALPGNDDLMKDRARVFSEFLDDEVSFFPLLCSIARALQYS